MIFDGNRQAFQVAQNIMFVMSLQHLKKEVTYEVEFLYADNHQNFL